MTPRATPTKAKERTAGADTKHDEGSLRVETTAASLCETCANVRVVCTARSRFLLCELSLVDAAYPKYPPQPVARCNGYRLGDETEADPPTQVT